MNDNIVTDEAALPKDEQRKLTRVTYIYILVAFSYFVSFIPLYVLVFHQTWMAKVNVIFGLLCIGVLIYFWRVKNALVASLCVSALAATTVTLMSLFRSPPEGATYGVFGGSIFLFFILPRKYYIGFVGTMVAVLATALALSLAGYVALPYTQTEYFILLVSLLFDNSLLILYGREKAKVDRKLNRSLKEIRKLAHELEHENERVEAEVVARTNEYKKEHAKLETSIQSLRIGFALIDQNKQLVSINKTALQILELQSTNHKDRSPDELITTDAVSKKLAGSFQFIERIEACMKEKRHYSVKNLRFGERFLAISLTPVIENDESFGVVVLVEDTTESKALERSRDEFFSIASHELRTPLTAIVGNASLLEEYYGTLDKKQINGMLVDIRSAGERLNTLVSNFLDMSRLEQGNVTIQIQPVNASDAVREVLQELSRQATGKSLKLHTTEPTHARYVMADMGRLKQVLMNLVENAIKYTDHGEVVVSIEPHGAETEIAIRDTGKGISEATQYLLFRKLQQASDDILTRDDSQSTGLGLYISRMIARAMKGDVYLRNSAPRQGSTFVIKLPTSHKR